MSESNNSFFVFFHWFAWAISVLASILFVVYLVGEGIPDISHGKAKELIPVLPFLIIAIAGCLVSFFRQKAGGIMMLIGGVAIEVVLYIQHGQANFGMMMVYGLPYILPGILFLLVKK